MSISTPSSVRLIRNDDGQRHHYVSIGHQQIVCSDLGITVTVHLTLMLDGVSFQGCSPVHLICPAMPVEAQRNSRHPVPRRRGVGHRHERWDGLRWTRQRRAREVFAGRVFREWASRADERRLNALVETSSGSMRGGWSV